MSDEMRGEVLVSDEMFTSMKRSAPRTLSHFSWGFL